MFVKSFQSIAPLAAITPRELDRRVEEVRKGFENHPPPERPNNFGKVLSTAVQKRLAGRQFKASAKPDDSFAAKLVKAVAARTRKQPQRHQPTKGE